MNSNDYIFMLRALGLLTVLILCYRWFLDRSNYPERKIKKLYAFLDKFKICPSNSLEMSLVEGHLEDLINGYKFKERHEKFWEKLSKSPLIVVQAGAEESERGQTFVAELPVDGIRFWMAFSSRCNWDNFTKSKWPHGFLTGTGLTFLETVNSRNEKNKRSNNGIALNMGCPGYTTTLGPSDVRTVYFGLKKAQLKQASNKTEKNSEFYQAVAERSTDHAIAFKYGEKVRIGYPNEAPALLIENLMNFFKTRREVKFGYLGLLEQTENYPQFRYVVAIDVDEMGSIVSTDFYEEMNVVANASGLTDERPVDFLLTESGNFISDYLTLLTAPFYTRDNIKDFSWIKSKVRAVEIIPFLEKKKKLRIKISSLGDIFINGQSIKPEDLEAILARLKDCAGEVLYYREAAEQLASDYTMQVIKHADRYSVPITLSTKEDFSDWVDRSGKSHVRKQFVKNDRHL